MAQTGWTVNRLYEVEEEHDDTRVVLDDPSEPSVGALKLTWKTMVEHARSVAGQLDALFAVNGRGGLKGQSVAVVLPNGADYVITFLAIACGGAINCLLNPLYREAEISYAVKDLKCDLILIPSSGHSEALKSGDVCCVPVATIGWESATKLGVHMVTGGQDISSPSVGYKFPEIAGGDIALKLHTSGTTSKPKTVPICHSNIVATLLNQWRWFGWLPERDASFLVMPLFHVHGLFNGCLGPLAAKCRISFISSKAFSKTCFWEDLVQAQANMITAVPSIWSILMLDVTKIPREKLAPIRYIRGCSSSLPPALLETLKKELGTVVVESYAMSEATHQMTSTSLTESMAGFIGYPTGTEIAVVATDGSGRICDADEAGEICVRGYNVITGYEGLDEEANKQHFYFGLKKGASFASTAPTVDFTADMAFKEVVSKYQLHALERDFAKAALPDRPFLRTGDLGKMDGQGRIAYISRLKELINRGGEKISPIEIDAVYARHADVKAAASFGYPDEILGEAVAIVVVPKDHVRDVDALVEELKKLARENLMKAKVPAYTFVADQLPTGPTGKVLRRELSKFVKENELVARK